MKTPQADDLLDADVEALLTGRSVTGNDGLFATISTLLLDHGRVPPASPALASVLTAGLTAEPGAAGVLRARWAAWWRRGAAGLAVALASLTGAATANALPGPIQSAVATTVNALSPFEQPDGHSGGAEDEEVGQHASPAPRDDRPGPLVLPDDPADHAEDVTERNLRDDGPSTPAGGPVVAGGPETDEAPTDGPETDEPETDKAETDQAQSGGSDTTEPETSDGAMAETEVSPATAVDQDVLDRDDDALEVDVEQDEPRSDVDEDPVAH